MLKKMYKTFGVLLATLLLIGCDTQQYNSIQYVITTNTFIQTEEIAQKSKAMLKTNDQMVKIEDAKYHDDCRYIITINTFLNKDEVVSLLKEMEWIEKILINYEVKTNQ